MRPTTDTSVVTVEVDSEGLDTQIEELPSLSRVLDREAVQLPQQATETTTMDEVSDIQPVLEAIEDPVCREILSATGDQAMTANELSEAFTIPLSTAYRKLCLLRERGLLAERTRLSQEGNHVSEYVRLVSAVTVALDRSGHIEVEREVQEEADRP